MGQWKREVAGGRDSRDIKVMLAQEFVARFREGAIPEDMPEVRIAADPSGLPLAQALKLANLAASTSEAMRRIEQGGVKVDGARVSDRGPKLAKGTVAAAQVGKRKFARICVD